MITHSLRLLIHRMIKIEKIEHSKSAKLGIKASFIEEIPFPMSIKAGVMFDNQAQFHQENSYFP